MNTQIETADLTLAAALQYHGVKLDGFEKIGARAIFFMSPPEELIAKYDVGELMVEPVAFTSIVRRLNTAIKRAI